MKNFKNTQTFKYLFVLLTMAVAALSSCKKDNPVITDTSTNTTATAYLMITNAADGSASQDLLLDNVKLSGSTVAYTQSSGYIAVPAGNHNAQFVTSGTTNVNSTTSLSLQAGQYYSIYYNGSTSSSTSTTDDLSAPSSGMAKVRFVNLSAFVTGAVDFGTSATAKLATNLAAKTTSAYYTVTGAATNFSMYAAGSATATLNISANLQAGKIYTIYVYGATSTTLTYKVVSQN